MRKTIDKEQFLLALVIVDILLFPYFNLVVVPMSYVIILIWVWNNRRQILEDWEIKPILLCMGLMLVSTAWGCVVNSEYGVIGNNIKRLIQYYFVFGYYFFFKYSFNRKKINIKFWLWIFFAFVVFLGIVYQDRKSTRLNSSHSGESRMPSSA